MRALLALSLVLATAAPVFAEVRNEVTTGGYTRAMRASSANAVTSDSLGGGTFGYARRLDLGLLPRLQTWVTGNYTYGTAEGTMFSTLTTEIDTMSFTAGGRARYALLDHVVLGARVDLGTAYASLKLAEGNRELTDSGWGGTTTVATSVDLFAHTGESWNLGVRLELGYTLTSAIELAPAEANDSSTIQLEMSQASLGHLDVGGRFFSFAVLSQF